MPYNPQTDQSMVVSKYHHKLVHLMADMDSRKLRAELQVIIEEAAAKRGIKVEQS